MVKTINLFLFAFLISINLFPQQKNYLISVELSDKNGLNKLEKFQLPVYHIFNNVLITEVSEVILNSFSLEHIQYNIVDDNPLENKYYITSPHLNELNPVFNPTNVIYNDGKNFVLKNPDINSEELISNYNSLIAMKRKPFYFENNKIDEGQTISVKNDSLINKIVEQVNPDTVRFFIKSLQDFKTRFLFAQTKDSVSLWIKSQFQKMGYTDVKIDSFNYQGTWQKNVVATLHSLSTSNEEIVVGGHHDSYSSGNPILIAPGADDNASGTTAVLEIARVLSRMGYKPETTIKFVTFAAEEYGLFGGFDYAQKAYSAGKKIKLMINHDMISNFSGSLQSGNININYYTGAEDYREIAKQSTQKFSVLNAKTGSLNSSGSDSYAFWSYGFPAVYFEEYSFSPYYHSPRDIIDNCNISYCAEVIKGSCATLLNTDIMLSKVKNFSVVDLGTGNSLKLSWQPSAETDLAGYNIYIGKSSGVYDAVLSTTNTTMVLDNLTKGVKYYIGISAVDNDGNSSMIVEKSLIPQLVPVLPTGLVDVPQMHSIEIRWKPNIENDLLGYNIYRSSNESGNYIKLNSSIVQDTLFLDSTPQNGIYYYYSIKAIDSTLNESSSAIIKSRSVSLDQGILVVDKTADGNGTIGKPSDAEVDDFYNSLLTNFNKKDFDIAKEGLPKLADLGAYSTIFVHGDESYSTFSGTGSTLYDLVRYLQFGGRLIISGFLPSKTFEKNIVYPREFFAGDFFYDFLKIKRVNKVFSTRFSGAISADDDYISIFTDSSKLNSATSFQLKDIESIEPNDNGNVIYKFDSRFDSTTVAGSMKGLPVGVEYLGTDYKVITLSFPLYYMKQEQAKEFVQNILLNKFNEATPVEKNEVKGIPDQFELMQNYPNPFNPTTKIQFSIPAQSFVTLKVFNILGRELTTLVNEEKNTGSYEVEFDGSKLTSGVYFYQIKAGNYSRMKKMILMK
ncbi:MAG: M20/M25/M40 family metallo-hydrolase [Ignavibacteriales bacterium]|nr:M20/M25/M40 family metallo-hydrolase [Ignavibacteriales bacterium]